MGDETPPPLKGKENGPSFVQCPMLTSTNYTVWAMRMKIVLRVHKVWDTIDPGVTDPDKNDMATALLFQSVPETLIMQIGDQETAKAIWDSIKTRHLGAERVREARLQTLSMEFDNMKMNESDSIDNFAGKLSSIASKSAALGEVIDEARMVKKFLKSLPRSKYIQMVASLEQVLDLNKTGFEDVVGRLRAYEERIREEEMQGDDQGKVLFGKYDSSSHRNYESNRGRGRGGRGRGRGTFNDQNRAPNTEQGSSSRGKEKVKKDRSKIVCYRCDKLGHFASGCPDRVQNRENFDDAAYMHQVVFLNEQNLIPKKYETEPVEDDIWYLDNGASNHMTGNRSYFLELNENITGKVKFGDESHVQIKGKGSILFQEKSGEQNLLTEIYYIPELKNNIISLGQATESGCDIRMRHNLLTMHDENGRLLMCVTRSANRLYKIRMKIGAPVCLHSKVKDDAWRWHARLGHINFELMKLMAKKDLVRGLPHVEHLNQLCESCLVGKQTRRSFPATTSFRATRPLELVHGDLCGPITPPTISGNRYVFVIIDDYSRYMWTFLLKEKGEAFESFKRFKALIETEAGLPMKTLRTDRGGEFTSRDFNRFCDESGIIRHLTAPYTPQQNGVVERRNRTLMGMVRSILKAMQVPNYMWGEAVRHSTFLINRVPTRALVDQTPYERFKKKKPIIEHVRVFGCMAYAKVDSVHLKKLDDRSRQLVYLGSETGSKAYRLFDPNTRKIIVSRDVVFDENKAWNWEKKVETDDYEPGMFSMVWGGAVDNGTGQIEPTSEDMSGSNPSSPASEPASSESSTSAEPSHNEPNSSAHSHDQSMNNESPVHSGEYEAQPGLRRSDRVSVLPRRLQEDYVLHVDSDHEKLLLTASGEPSSYNEAKSNQEWVRAMNTEIDSINKNETWKLVELPKGAKCIGLKWVFKIKRNADGTINKYKARLVAKGYVQQPGIDFDDVFAPVARIETIRLLIALAASNGWEIHHLDIKTAFLHGELKEVVFVSQPEGYEKRGEEAKVYKLSKALYGLRQAPRAWNTKLDSILRDMKFQKCSKEQSVYRKTGGKHFLIVAVYVDDLFVTGTSSSIISDFKKGMSTKFEMSDLGKLTYYLGIEVFQREDGITITQEGYAKRILKETGMQNCNPSQVPMDHGVKFSKAENETELDATEYRKVVGCLRYLLHTRPDMAYSVGIVSRYMQSPRESHGMAIRNLLRYLKKTTSYGIKYGKNGSRRLVGYCDSSHNIDEDDGRSTTGHVFYYGQSPISWCSQKQTTVALSSCEAEYMAASAAACQALWLRELLSELTGEVLQKVILKVDNTSAIALVKNPVFHSRTKHIKSRFHFIRDCYNDGEVDIEHISGKEQRADILTKALARIKFTEMRELLGVEDLSNSDSEIRGVIVGN